MSKKRTFWAFIGKLLWTLLSLVLRVVAALGSRWARKKLDQHAEKQSGGTKKRILRLAGRR